MALIPIKSSDWVIISDNISMNDSSKLNNGEDGYMFHTMETPSILKGPIVGNFQLYIDTGDMTLHLEESNGGNNCYKISLNSLPFFVAVGDPTSCSGNFRAQIFPKEIDSLVSETNFQCFPHCIGENRQCFLRTDKTKAGNQKLYDKFISPDFDFSTLISQGTKTDCINSSLYPYWKCDESGGICSNTKDITPYTNEGDCNKSCGKQVYWDCINGSCKSVSEKTPYESKASCEKACKKGGSSNLLVNILIGVAVLIVIAIIALIVYMYMLKRKNRYSYKSRVRGRSNKRRMSRRKVRSIGRRY